MPKEKINRSEAILREKRNTKRGLQLRNKILLYLYKKKTDFSSTSTISDGIGIKQSIVLYHLNNLLNEKIVNKEMRGREAYWSITGLGQQTIKKWIAENQQED
ncbi:transcriptional regulator [Candidatus Heimdallarchaeota archaeon]|jgi:predicted transcriptional regulator|nr:MAG: transcriptional regulator [Candidatus Heimdallarchaeota archaeon]